MTSISVLIASRYIYETKKVKNISTMLKMSFLAISIGSFALALSMCIMIGFEKDMHQKMQNIHPNITIQAQNNFLNYENIKKILDKDFPEIESHAPSDIQFAIINENNDISNVIAIKGIQPIAENKINNFFSKITKNINNNFENLFKNDQILISEKISKELNFHIGDQIILLIPQKNLTSTKLSFEKTLVIISGFYNTGIDEFDNKVIFSSLDFLEKHFPESGISQIGIKLKNESIEEEVIKKLKKRFKLTTYSWKELYPALISTLKLEKYIVFIIFTLISFIAGINIISLLFMIISYKKKDLIILKSMGLPNNEIQKIFLLIGTFITALASLSGLFLAFICSIILKNFCFIKLPDLYQSSFLPIHLSWQIFLLIFLVVLTIGIISSLIPSRNIINSNIANDLKNLN